ncbi:MAG: ribose 5-phosphate isomerase B [Bacteroidetes bacterium]|nr:MAG: ribose 5-phosphate isomerase B [Bacteroidota bacterium]
MKIRSIGIGSDHAGFLLKEKVKKHVEKLGYEVKDFGPFSEDSVDYPDFAHPVSESVKEHEVDLGILMCGSGNGINMSANKHNGVRAALCWTDELAELARSHNNANILSLPARFIDEETALGIVSKFLATNFEGGRHELRVEKIDEIRAC